MSLEDDTVGAPAGEPHIPPTPHRHTPIKEHAHIYMTLLLPPLPPSNIQILFNNKNGLKTENYEMTTAPLQTTLK